MITSLAFRRAGRIWHLATFASIAIGLIWQLTLTLQGVNLLVDENGNLPGYLTRVIRYLSYFTVESNILVAVTVLVLVVRPDEDGRIWRILRVEALYGITVTGVVYSTLLRGIVDLHGAAAVTNALLHYVAPLLAVVGWLIFGPRPRITDNTLIVSLAWPALYVAYTLAHGAVSHWYPYPFIDVTQLGYVTALRNGVGLNLLLVGLGALFMWFDGRLWATDDGPDLGVRPEPGTRFSRRD